MLQVEGHEQIANKEKVKGIIVDRNRDSKLTDFGKAMMKESYLLPGESFQDRFANVADHYSNDIEHAQRIYDYISNHWFMPATPVLSNGGTTRGQPISCFLNEANDSLSSIRDLWVENVELASKGGGIGSYWGNIRSIGEKVGLNGKTSGIMPFVKVQDSLTLAISQGSLRRGSAAGYLPVWHPEIEEFIEMRRDTGGDKNRRAPNTHHGVLVSNAFMEAVDANADWNLLSPKTNEVVRVIRARDLWIRILTARIEEGEPYIIYIDHVNDARPEWHKKANLLVKTSNLCAEITLPTGLDHHGRMRTAVCCLSSLNLETWDEWKDHPTFIEDVLMFLDNILSEFIRTAPSERKEIIDSFIKPIIEELKKLPLEDDLIDTLEKSIYKSVSKQFSGLMDQAIYSASRERSVGLGVMGFHSFLQMKKIPFESPMAKVWNKKIFKHIQQHANDTSKKLADERGPCPDAADFDYNERFTNKTAIAPTASISVICGQASAGIEPFVANSYLEKRKIGSFLVRNKHLERVLEGYERNDDDTWTSIMINEGSVQHLDFLSSDEKEVYKTACEIDQNSIIDLAADRAPMIDQAQSLNVFLPADVHKKVLHEVHTRAWQKGVKSLYYCRSIAVHRAQKVSLGSSVTSGSISSKDTIETEKNNYEVCESCQ